MDNPPTSRPLKPAGECWFAITLLGESIWNQTWVILAFLIQRGILKSQSFHSDSMIVRNPPENYIHFPEIMLLILLFWPIILISQIIQLFVKEAISIFLVLPCLSTPPHMRPNRKLYSSEKHPLNICSDYGLNISLMISCRKVHT